jgi:hypothetical protein
MASNFTIVQDIVGQTFAGTLKQLVAGPNYYVLDGVRRNVAGIGASFRLILDPPTVFKNPPNTAGTAPLPMNQSQWALEYARIVDAMFVGR